MRILGIDPGVNGAVAVFCSESPADVTVHSLPAVTVPIGGKKRRRLDLDQCWSMLNGLTIVYEPVLAVLEDVNGFAGNVNSTGASGFTFGRAAGNIEGMIVALQIPRHYVTPVVWKKTFKLTGKGPELKTASRIAASQLFPKAASMFALVKDDGVAEAALLARYGLTTVQGKQL